MRAAVPLLFAAIVLPSGCAKVPVPPGPLGVVRDAEAIVAPPGGPPPAAVAKPSRRAPPAPAASYGDRLAQAARALLDGPYPPGHASDCSGFVCAASVEAGGRLPSSTQALWELAVAQGAVHRRHRPDPGDLAFFDDTWDRNGNGRLDDPLTHVGVVVGVLADGTVEVAHVSSSKGRSLLRLNLDRPGDASDEEGRVLNDYLRRRARRDPRATKYLAGELWRGFAAVSPEG